MTGDNEGEQSRCPLQHTATLAVKQQQADTIFLQSLIFFYKNDTAARVLPLLQPV